MKKRIFKIARIFLYVFLFLVVVLAIHIYVVTRNKPNRALTQLSRIDFKQKVDSYEAHRITGFVGHLYGVQKAYMNIADGVLIYGYSPLKQNSTTVYNDLITFGHYDAERIIINRADIAKGCPVFDQSSFGYRISNFFSKIFH